MNFLVILSIKGYQLFISPLLKGKCRFYPSCSHYSLGCFQKFTFFQALWYSGKRILKCHPFHEGGIDNIPQDGNKTS